MKRMRRGHRHGGGGGGGFRHSGGGNNGNQPLNRNHVFDSSGPDVRLRGTAQQLFEKYLQLGRDATSGGDRVAAEGYFQHAEHYFRILGAMNAAQAQQQERRFRDNAGEASAQDAPAEGNGDGLHPLEAELAGEAQSLPMPRLPGAPAEEPAAER
ncbi:DUF4167 domain-containing protein [Sabulicella rubraurantiaca]|uniref:DUF4167 domain-containing protein n=1 Tax=Sabulicella rubraurantiaca TaxID=2811429 RepID=UPI0038B4A76C